MRQSPISVGLRFMGRYGRYITCKHILCSYLVFQWCALPPLVVPVATAGTCFSAPPSLPPLSFPQSHARSQLPGPSKQSSRRRTGRTQTLQQGTMHSVNPNMLSLYKLTPEMRTPLYTGHFTGSPKCLQ